ncbi:MULTISPECIES: putative glycolipid-binding domain-containing protein [unclassified Agromyces]|uniref:putative glycolipid-binding domain-containing protein n=1 Tax=unclassified Agromyces TaxID=2639701 RepID=UPI003015475C
MDERVASDARTCLWADDGDADRVESASVRFDGAGMRAIGGARAASYATAWELDVDDGWRTLALRITARGLGWSRSLDLERSPQGEWRAVATQTGDVDLPAPGLADPSSVAGALDCDLGLCPLTNTMPIRRLGLLDADVPETALVMAWVDVPSLRVIRSEQGYASASVGGRRRVRFRSLDGDFAAELEVDDDGVVVDYPGIGRRVGLTAGRPRPERPPAASGT